MTPTSSFSWESVTSLSSPRVDDESTVQVPSAAMRTVAPSTPAAVFDDGITMQGSFAPLHRNRMPTTALTTDKYGSVSADQDIATNV